MNRARVSDEVANRHRSRLLLIEGVPGIGKSTLFDRLLRRYVSDTAEARLRTVFSLAQTHTYGPLAGPEDRGTLTREDCLDHLARIVGWIEWLVEGARAERRTKCVVLIDTLHMTCCLRPGVVRWGDVSSFDRSLAALGCRLLLLDAHDDTIRARTVEARAETEFIRNYAIGRFGRDHSDLTRHFCCERDAFREMFDASTMPKLTMRAEMAADDLAAAAAGFWLAE